MTTQALFREDAYLTQCDAVVQAVGEDGIRLDRTVFYPLGGGQAGDTGTLTLPDDRDDTRRAALEFLRAGLSRNLEGAPQAASVPVPLAAGGAVNGLELRIAGAAAGGDRARKTIVARLVARGRHAYQAVVIADGSLTQEQLDQFFGSFKLD